VLMLGLMLIVTALPNIEDTNNQTASTIEQA
jgi:hypothetical protein